MTTESGLDEKTVKKLARLAKLSLDDAEVRALLPELQSIVRHVDALRAIDTTGVPPMTHGAPLEEGEAANAIAAPSPPSASPDHVLGRTAIEQSAGYDAETGTVKVPKVIE